MSPHAHREILAGLIVLCGLALLATLAELAREYKRRLRIGGER
jgi:hypothetical protein